MTVAWCSATHWPGEPGVPSLWVCDQPAGHGGDHTDRDERASWPRPPDPAALVVTAGEVLRIRTVN